MTWTLFVFVVVTINGAPAYLQALVPGSTQFATLEACAAHGRPYVSRDTRVACEPKGRPPVEVQA